MSARTVPAAPNHRKRFFQEASLDQSKRVRTRALILDTAIELVAEKGIERASIAEITQRAGLSNGSFYYYFRDKTDLLDTVGGAMAAILVREVDDAIAHLDDGIERVAAASMLFVRRAVSAPTWGGLVVHALAELGEFREQISEGIQKDVRIGIEQGQFTVPSSPALSSLLLALVSAAIREHLADPVQNAGLEILTSQLILRALGVDANTAERVANRVSGTSLSEHDHTITGGVRGEGPDGTADHRP